MRYHVSANLSDDTCILSQPKNGNSATFVSNFPGSFGVHGECFTSTASSGRSQDKSTRKAQSELKKVFQYGFFCNISPSYVSVGRRTRSLLVVTKACPNMKAIFDRKAHPLFFRYGCENWKSLDGAPKFIIKGFFPSINDISTEIQIMLELERLSYAIAYDGGGTAALNYIRKAFITFMTKEEE